MWQFTVICWLVPCWQIDSFPCWHAYVGNENKEQRQSRFRHNSTKTLHYIPNISPNHIPHLLKGNVLTARRKSRKHQCFCLKSLTSGGPTAHNVIRPGNRKFQESPAWQHGWPRCLRPEARGSHTWFARAAQHKQNNISPNCSKNIMHT